MRIAGPAEGKAGLNKKILTAAWGKTVAFTRYKAVKAGKLCIKINPYQTSQKCAECGHIHPGNRVSQSAFVCQACGYQDRRSQRGARYRPAGCAIAAFGGLPSQRGQAAAGSFGRKERRS
ncbi:MAG: zinc ribbon domain-containing protein [Acidiferrobacter sp.]